MFSFKLRGAYNKIAHLTPDERARGIITASAGNHSQGVAFSARKLGLRARSSSCRRPRRGSRSMRCARWAPRSCLPGDSYGDAKAHCDTLVAQTGMTFIHSVRRPARHRGAGDHRRRDPAPQPGSSLGRVRSGRRRRAHRRHCRLHQGAAAGREGDRRRAVRGRRACTGRCGRARASTSITSGSSPTVSPCARSVS